MWWCLPKIFINGIDVNSQKDDSIATKGSFSWKNSTNHLIWSVSFRGNYIITICFGNSVSDFERSKSAYNAKKII